MVALKVVGDLANLFSVLRERQFKFNEYFLLCTDPMASGELSIADSVLT